MINTNEQDLRTLNEEVLQEEIPELIKKLERGLHFAALTGKPGIGLAAPQIGIHKKAAIIRIPSSNNLSVNLINAKIEKSYEPFIMKDEGCLSFDGQMFDTTRYNEVHVTGNAVFPHSFSATGLFAVAVQHELDHLDGVLFFDRKAKPMPKLKPNELCFCGSKKKFKRCHFQGKL